MADEEFHEIQLNGKQLVFLFMAGTVAAVVIFLCGLMVGRNIRMPRVEAATTVEATVSDPTRVDQVPPPATDPTESGTPVTTKEKLTYSNYLSASAPPVEDGLETETKGDKHFDSSAEARGAKAEKVAIAVLPADSEKPEKVKDAKARDAVPVPKTAAVTPKDVASKDVAARQGSGPVASEPAGNGWSVQVQAVTSRADADAIAQRLSAKGYPAFVTLRKLGNNDVRYAIRVGKYSDKHEAEAMKTKLEQKEQFKPWVTR